jgi:hypothetical protein
MSTLAVGQRVMRMFELVDFEPNRHLTIKLDRPRWFAGAIVASYCSIPVTDKRSRLVVKLLIAHPRGSWGRALVHQALALGDLFMMRRQLLTLKKLAENIVPPVANRGSPSRKAKERVRSETDTSDGIVRFAC